MGFGRSWFRNRAGYSGHGVPSARALLFFVCGCTGEIFFASDCKPDTNLNFDSDKTGEIPAGFHGARTGQGSEGTWVVTADSTAPSKPNVVAQTSRDHTDYRFPLLIADQGTFKD